MSQALLMNLLPYRPMATGLSRYSEQMLAGWTQATGSSIPMQLRLSANGRAELACTKTLPSQQLSRRMRWLQSISLVQHGVQVSQLIEQADPAVIYSPYTDYLFAAKNRPQVITCHDLIPLHYPSSRRAYWRSRLWLPHHLESAEKVIAISRSVADLLIAQGLNSERIVVIPNGVESVSNPIQSPASQDALVIARHASNKNIALALQGFSNLLLREPGWTGCLRIVGSQGSKSSSLLSLVRSLGLKDRVQWFFHLDSDSLERMLRQSYCLLAPSRMEGFDYPLFEAQARGIPTLASRIPVHEELHGSSALFFELDDGGVSLGEVWQRLARSTTLWQQLSQIGLIHAQDYSLDRQISSVKALIDQVISPGQLY